jgi:hypothetical protein
VTPHPWKDEKQWRVSKQADRVWLDVRVIDGPILEDWIEQCPAVDAWFAQHLKKLPGDVDSLDSYWEEWAAHPKYKTKPELPTAGRSEQVKMFRERLLSGSSIIPIKSTSREESLAFAVAAVMLMDDLGQEHIVAKSLVVRSEQAFRELSQKDTPFTLFTNFDDLSVYNLAASKGHQVVVSLGADAITTNYPEVIELPRLGREELVEAMVNMGFSREEAETHSKESGRNLTILRGRLGYFRQPSRWVQKDNVRQIIPAVLCGAWNERKEGDIEVFEKLTKLNYSDFVNAISA